MNALLRTALVASLACAGAAHASDITFEAAASGTGAQSSAADYRAVVDQAMLSGGQSASIALFDDISSHGVFGGDVYDHAVRATISFDVSAANAGDWAIRAGVDFGLGGAVFLDGAALAFKSNDMWWAGSYADTSQSFQFSGLQLGAGNHTLQLYGLEHCCDGGQQVQYAIGDSAYQTFGANDGLTPAVPEPETYALMLGGLGAMVFMARRRRTN